MALVARFPGKSDQRRWLQNISKLTAFLPEFRAEEVLRDFMLNVHNPFGLG